MIPSFLDIVRDAKGILVYERVVEYLCKDKSARYSAKLEGSVVVPGEFCALMYTIGVIAVIASDGVGAPCCG